MKNYWSTLNSFLKVLSFSELSVLLRSFGPFLGNLAYILSVDVLI